MFLVERLRGRQVGTSAFNLTTFGGFLKVSRNSVLVPQQRGSWSWVAERLRQLAFSIVRCVSPCWARLAHFNPFDSPCAVSKKEIAPPIKGEAFILVNVSLRMLCRSRFLDSIRIFVLRVYQQNQYNRAVSVV